MKKIILIVFVFCFTGLSAQFKRPFFNTISTENGLPEGYVQSSLQDKQGYLWFGTQNGLVRQTVKKLPFSINKYSKIVVQKQVFSYF